MYTRDANNNDEAWMLEKLSQNEREEESFRSRDFRIGVDEDSSERVAFGRLRYHRNTDDTEYVELSSVLILDRASDDQGCQMLVDLAEQAQDSGYNRVFTFPHEDRDLFREVGFEPIDRSELPTVMEERLDDKSDRLDINLEPMAARPKAVEFEVDEDDEDDAEKPGPESVSDEEIETIKDDLGVDNDTTYKYDI